MPAGLKFDIPKGPPQDAPIGDETVLRPMARYDRFECFIARN